MEIRELFAHWQLRFEQIREDLTPSGSPNRTVRRFTAAANGKLYIAEGFDPRKKAHQQTINNTLEYLAGKAAVNWAVPYLRTSEGNHGVFADNCFWQLRPWIEADPLPRSSLGENTGYASMWCNILLDLKNASANSGFPHQLSTPFRFRNYLPTLSAFAARKMPQISTELNRLISALKPFLDIEDSLPLAFAHGDFHPGNILISGDRVQSVIDWEFCGMKCAGYDLALLMGCLGADDPGWLDGAAFDFLLRFLKKHNYLPQEMWHRMPELIAAVRLGWLGEWIDLGDQKLAVSELEYIRFLLS